ncbi:YqgE/AlgH family protein [Azotobacter beijerinckii]|nr:YqgE/AlgH family protein [Azotobacter beijerinckii]MDV7212563.1 YqgE/AlgH family protein [Azotobacter beijerinckii]
MKMNTTPHYLKHHFLIAMPHMADPNFAQALVYLVDHNDQGAMGLVVNRPSELDLGQVLAQLSPDSPTLEARRSLPIYTGGPVQTDRGFVLHAPGYRFQATLELDGLALSTSQDTLLAIADGSGPARCLIALGYAGWDAGQLEAELLQNTWLTCPADPAILFDTPAEQRLPAAAARLGINLALLTSQAGHA